MPDLKRRELLAMSAVAPLAGLLLSGKVAVPCPPKPSPKDDLTTSPAQLAERRKIQQRYFPNVPLITQDGKKVHFFDDLIKNKIVVINMFYTHCEGVCTPIAQHLAEAQKDLGKLMGHKIFFVSVSLKPQEDTPPVLKKFAEMVHAGPGWTFLTGKPANIELLRRSMEFTDYNPKIDKDTTRHSGMLRIGNEPYTIWTSCQGMGKPRFIAQSIKWVIEPAAASAAVLPRGPACPAAVAKA